MLEQFQALVKTIGILDIVDTGLVAFFLYRIYIMLKNTRAAALVKGLMVLASLVIVSKWLNLHVINWILEKAITMMMVALPVVFQPELRRALEQIGRGRLFRKRIELDEAELKDMIETVANATVIMGQRKIGALIVFERAVGLEENRAAIGISEQSDALVVVVSEETGTVSVTRNGEIFRYLRREDVVDMLQSALMGHHRFTLKQLALEKLDEFRNRKTGEANDASKIAKPGGKS